MSLSLFEKNEERNTLDIYQIQRKRKLEETSETSEILEQLLEQSLEPIRKSRRIEEYVECRSQALYVRDCKKGLKRLESLEKKEINIKNKVIYKKKIYEKALSLYTKSSKNFSKCLDNFRLKKPVSYKNFIKHLCSCHKYKCKLFIEKREWIKEKNNLKTIRHWINVQHNETLESLDEYKHCDDVDKDLGFINPYDGEEDEDDEVDEDDDLE